jgi:hypothetical protein
MRRPLALAAAAIVSLTPVAGAQTTVAKPGSKGKAMTQRAAGTFEVKMQPLPDDEKVPGVKVVRLAWEKQWQGDLEATSKGEMMATNAGDKGSGAYVAVEQVTGRLQGRAGSFTAVHKGTMEGGAFELQIDVVPGSATGQLTGLSGRIRITIADGKHSYDIDYALPD